MMKSKVTRDILFLIQPDFTDPAFPEKRFYCWHCALMEGLLASFPAFAKNLDVRRVPWLRPREAVVALVGEKNQSLPLLVLAAGSASIHQTGTYEGNSFVNEKDAILRALSERHGFPEPHP